jgi:hypothetical protein
VTEVFGMLSKPASPTTQLEGTPLFHASPI